MVAHHRREGVLTDPAQLRVATLCYASQYASQHIKQHLLQRPVEEVGECVASGDVASVKVVYL